MALQKNDNMKKALAEVEEIERITAQLLQKVSGKPTKKSSNDSVQTKTSQVKLKNSKDKTPKTQKKLLKPDATSMNLGFGNTADLFNKPRNTIEVLDDTSPDHTPRINERKTILSNNYTNQLNSQQSIEKDYRELPLTNEKPRISTAYDTFVPAPGITLTQVQNERNRLQSIEDTSKISKEKYQNLLDSRMNYVKQDWSALKIQALYRGYVGRKKYLLSKNIQNILNNHNDDNSNDWVEIRDRTSGEHWYYNQITGKSQYERPIEMASTLSNKSSLKVISSLKKTLSRTASSEKIKIKSDINLPKRAQTSITKLKPLSKLINEKEKDKEIELERQKDLEKEYQLQKEVNEIMGYNYLNPEDNLLLPDGHFKPQLRTTILDTLLNSRFDSVSNVIADDRWSENNSNLFVNKVITTKSLLHDKSIRVNRLNKPMVSIMQLDEKKKNQIENGLNINTISASTDKIPSKLSDLTVSDILHPKVDHTNENNNDINNLNPSKDICFACWSSGSKFNCTLHNDINEKLKSSQTMLLCRNWDLSVMKRRYRSEEIQEIFMKRNTSLRYNIRRKKFTTVEELRHIIYRLLKTQNDKYNSIEVLYMKIKRWLLSLADEVRLARYDHTNENNVFHKVKDQESVALLKSRKIRLNHNQVIAYTNSVINLIPKAPTTGYSYNESIGKEKYLYTVSDPATGQSVDLILVYPLPTSKDLYKLREYHLPIPKTIPMPKPEYVQNLLTNNFSNSFALTDLTVGELSLDTIITANKYIPDNEPYSWFERLINVTTRSSINNALTQVKAIIPSSTAGIDILKKIKIPTPSTIKFATLGRKPLPGNLAVGGLPMELMVYQLLNTYIPPQFGNFMVMDKAIISPGISPEIMITFESLTISPTKQVFILRPVEHPLNYRKAPTIGINSKLSIDDIHHYGENRSEQTGEIESHGFRTSTWSKYLEITDETDPIAFNPSNDVVSLNFPGSNKPHTTHANLTYPFCEPSTRDNSTLDFYHLLLSSSFSFAKPQIFSCLTVQEPGQFLKQSRDDLPLGYLVVSIYRSWAFVQKDVIEKFMTDDGIPYWYHRRTGQTFWERPLYDEEEVSPLQGGLVLDTVNDEEPMTLRQGPEGSNRRYLQGELRNNMLIHHETEREAIRRRWNAADAAVLAREKGIFPNIDSNTTNIDVSSIRPTAPFPSIENDEKIVTASKDIEKVIQDREDNALLGILMNSTIDKQVGKPGSMMAETTAMMDMEIQLKNNVSQTMIDNTGIFQSSGNAINNNLESISESPSKINVNRQPPLQSNIDTSMINSLTDTITKMLTAIDSTNPQDMLNLGLGMGMAMMQAGLGQSISAEPNKNMNVSVKVDTSKNTLQQSSGLLSSRSHISHDNSLATSYMPNISEDTLKSRNNTNTMVSSSKANARGTNGPEPIGLPNPTISTSAHKVLDHSEANQQIQQLNNKNNIPLSTMDKARRIVIASEENGLAITQTPDITKAGQVQDEIPRNADEKVKNKVPVLIYPELSTILPNGPPPESVTHPLAGTASNDENSSELVVGSSSASNAISILRRPVIPLPTGFHEAIVAAHVAKQEVDYLPQVPNLPQTRTVGRVKPRSTALDWIAISFDPWSAGKAPVSSEFVSSLSANAEKFFEGGAVKAANAIDQLKAETIGDAFASIQDVEGQQIQRAEISRAEAMLKDFNKICSLCRHNKFSEIEQLIQQPDWSLPIDYQDEQGNTLLHVAAQNGNKRMIKICLRKGISLDIQNLQGQTALHYLFGYGYTDVGEYLVSKGANDAIKNIDGLTCYEGLGARELSML